MGIFDKIKEAKDKIGDIINQQVDAMKPVIKVTMLGPRAVGKTSILAAILGETRDKIAGEGLFFRPAGRNEFENKRTELSDVVEKAKSFADQPVTGAVNATKEMESFKFEIGPCGGKATIDVEIIDYPGEFLDSVPEDVKTFIKESSIIMVAIDTPYLMEEGGKYNDEKNEPQKVIDFIVKHPDDLKNKLVMLVPLKSELYFHNHKIDDVSDEVEKVYVELIQFCKQHNIACVITPIQTIGGVEFDKFVDPAPNVISKYTKLSSYRFYGSNGKPPKYKPVFCVQPVYYLLTYVCNYYEWDKGQEKSWVEKLKGSIYSYLKDDDKMLQEIKKVGAHIITDGNGYRIVARNTIFNVK